jgi:hypothetical protein
VSDVATVLLYALVAAASPLTFAAMLVVLRSGNGRVNGIAFAVGFLVGQSCTCLVAVGIGSLATPGHGHGHDTATAVLALALGALLLVVAWRLRGPSPEQQSQSPPRASALLSRLARLRPLTALSIGTLLGIGGPKRLTITVLVATTISLGGFGLAEQLALVELYVVVASVLVWAPAVAYVIGGERAGDLMARAEAWLAAHQRPLAFGSMLVLGVLLVGEGLVRLL